MRRMGPMRRAWERHVQEALDVAAPTPQPLPPLPVRQSVQVAETEHHSDDCPCVICTTYQPHEITGNWHPSKGPRAGLYLVREEDDDAHCD